MADIEDLVALGLVLGAVYILSDALSGIEDALGVTPPAKPSTPATPVMQTTVFSPGVCPAGWIAADQDGNCIQVTNAIHPGQ